jgi:nitrogen fixation protein NifU and related proteins
VQMEQLYQEIILDHHRHPHHAGLRDPFDAEVQHVNPTCGDEVQLRVTLESDRAGGPLGKDTKILDVSYEAMGCSISQASTSVLTDLVIDRTVGEALGVLEEFTAMMTSRGTIEGDEDVIGDGIAFAGVSRYPARVKCALLGWMAFKDATSTAVSAAGHTTGSTR